MAAPTGLLLFDLLCMLPLDVVDSNIWGFLPRAYHQSLTHTSRQGQQLADLLVKSACHDISRRHLGGDHPDGDAVTDAAWQQTLDRVLASILRMPHLTFLDLQNWTSEDDLVAALGTYGIGTAGRLKFLSITAASASLSSATTEAICTACPHLMGLEVADDEDGAITPVDAAFFAPLRGLHALSQVTLLGRSPPQTPYPQRLMSCPDDCVGSRAERKGSYTRAHTKASGMEPSLLLI